MSNAGGGAMRVSFHAASGLSRERCAFTVARWDARRPPSHESSETSVFANEGGRTFVLHATQGLFAGVWRSDSGEVHFSVPGQVHRIRRSGDAWDRTSQAVPGLFPDLWGAWDDLAFGWGVGRMIRWDGASWAECPSPGDVYAVHGGARDLVFAAGRAGLLARWDGAWQRLEPPCAEDLVAVHAAAEDDVWAIAKPGTLLHGSTMGVRPVLKSDKKLLAVACFKGQVFVAVEDTGLFRFEGGALALVKDTFKPFRLDARDELLATAGEHVVGSPDGRSFKATLLKGPAALLEPHKPLWM